MVQKAGADVTLIARRTYQRAAEPPRLHPPREACLAVHATTAFTLSKEERSPRSDFAILRASSFTTCIPRRPSRSRCEARRCGLPSRNGVKVFEMLEAHFDPRSKSRSVLLFGDQAYWPGFGILWRPRARHSSAIRSAEVSARAKRPCATFAKRRRRDDSVTEGYQYGCCG